MIYPIFLCLFLTLFESSIFKMSEGDRLSRESPPNFVVIFMDDLGWGDLSSYGHPTIHTPHLDRMSREGQKWTNFYTACSVCSPSRGALLTGRYPIRIGLGPTTGGSRVFFPDSKGGLPPEEVTIAEVLKERGYKTGIVGKWHLGHLPQFLPTRQGFDSYYGIPYSNDMDHTQGWNLENLLGEPDITKWNVPLLENDTVIERPANQHTITKRYTEKAIEFIRENRDDPFFLYLPHTMVHTPLFASEDFLNTSSRGFYGDVMAEVDWSVGKILSTLKENDLDENTLVVFTSDNGPWLIMQEDGGSAGLLKDGKGTTWEGGMRVPGIFYMPGTVRPGIRTDLGSTLDLLPTFASMAGVSLQENLVLDGFDLSAVLKNGTASPRDHFIYYRNRDIYAVRKNNFKAHFVTATCYQLDNNRIEHEQPLLFDVDNDPGERFDRSKDLPEVVAELTRLADDHKRIMVAKPSELDKR